MEVTLEISEEIYKRYIQYYEPFRIEYRKPKGEGIGVFNPQAVQIPIDKLNEN